MQRVTWFGMGLGIEVQVLRRFADELHRIPKLAEQEASEMWESMPEEEREGPEGRDLSDYLSNELWEANEAYKTGFGALAVMAMSVVESRMKELLARDGVIEARRRSWQYVEGWFRGKTARGLASLSEYNRVDTLRLLSNCFKHNDGKSSVTLAKRLKIRAREEIDYVHQDWTGFLEAIEAFLLDAERTLGLGPTQKTPSLGS